MTLTLEIIGPVLAAVGFLVALFGSAHVVLYKRDSRSAIAWTGLIWLAPFVGTLLYVLLGINRIERKARALRTDRTAGERPDLAAGAADVPLTTDIVAPHMKQISRLVGKVTGRELTFGNVIEPLSGGDAAYPAMLEAIRSARHTIGLSTYIFDADEVGLEFAQALAEAVERRVEVRVLIDAVGAKYAFSSIVSDLEKLGVPVTTFNRLLLPWRFRYANLRNHRKIMTIDGKMLFTGGMNIRGCCVSSSNPHEAIHDLHFRLQGPIVKHAQDAFVSDWQFSTDQELSGDGWFPPLTKAGDSAARGIIAGPDEGIDQLRLTLLGACQCAMHSLQICTPYFLPDAALIGALNVAALRGVSVEILIPQHSNESLVQWACTSQLWQLVEKGCDIRRTRPPFDHSKLVIVDDAWVLMGSANWDPRSLRLNFEFNVECYDAELAANMRSIFETKKQNSEAVTIEDLESRRLVVKLRDGVARLASPFL